MATVWDYVEEIRKRPGMYIGCVESVRHRLELLEALLAGYHACLVAHGLDHGRAYLPREFAEYLFASRGWPADCGAIAAIREVVSNDEEVWELYWSLLHEYRSVELARQPA
jgi:hypothetical protein